MNWASFEQAAPALAALGRERFERDHLALIGTIRADGSPRISPIEPYLAGGHLLLGMEWPTSKARDLLRDPRCTLHSAVSDPDGADGEFKLNGHASAVDDPSVVMAPAEAWWRDRPPDVYRVFAIEIESAVFIGWNLDSNQVRLLRWSRTEGLTDTTRDRLS